MMIRCDCSRVVNYNNMERYDWDHYYGCCIDCYLKIKTIMTDEYCLDKEREYITDRYPVD